MAITLARASFGEIAFPTTEVSLTGGLRHHIHEYPHSPGGQPEKLGRRLYIVRMEAWFHELTGVAAANYPDLWPAGLKKLRELLESGETKDLVVPTVGTIRAFATSWTQKFVAANALDGEKVSLEFCEDSEDANLSGNEAEFAAAAVVDAMDKLSAALAKAEFAGAKRKPGIFEQLNDAVGAFTALKDQAEAQASLISDKLETIKSLAGDVADTLDIGGTAAGVGVDTASRNLWYAANEAQANLVTPAAAMLSFTVPILTSVVDLATTLYGRTDKVADLLRLNAFPDPYRIPPGTVVMYASQ
jgi:prophage DNA circulation protein